MSYQVLARKWRPQNFEQMVGQEHVLQALQNALNQQRLHHAYLFTGTRGVGKTTLGRIVTKCLNCERGISAKPCGECHACQAIEKGRFVDLIEVDAASRTSVDETRELLDNVQYAPSCGRFKVYLIDEVHMLSGHSFNALLKTLEEPPAHVKFLLATTDPQKLPITVLSRCLQFHLKNMLPEQIASYLQHVLEEEKITYEQAGLNHLARAADGSMRDALSLLDQAIAYSNGKISAQAVSQMLGTIEQTHIFNLLQALAAQNALAIINEIKRLAEQGADFRTVLEDLLVQLHQIALHQTIPELTVENEEVANGLYALAKDINKEDIQLWYQIALIGRRDLPLAPTPKIGIEMVLLRMLAFRPATVQPFTAAIAHSSSPTSCDSSPTSRDLFAGSSSDAPRSLARANKSQDVGELPHNWPELLKKLKLSGPTLALASHCSLKESTENAFTLTLALSYKALLNEERQKTIEQAINQQLGRQIKLTIMLEQNEQDSPAQLHAKQTVQDRQTTTTAFQNDANVKELLNRFDGTMLIESIK